MGLTLKCETVSPPGFWILRKWIPCTLSLIALCLSTPSFSDTPSAPTSSTSASSDSAPASSALTPLPRANNDQESADQFIAAQGEILDQVYEIERQLEVHLEQRRAEIAQELTEQGSTTTAEDTLLRMVKDGAVSTLRVEIPGIGKAEPTTIDGHAITRVVHESTGIAFLLVDDQITPGSFHLNQYIARQHRNAGTNGRHVVVVRLHRESDEEYGTELEVVSHEFSPKPRWRQAQYWREFKEDIYRAPTAGDLKLAGICAGLQVGISCSMSGLQVLTDPNAHFDSHPAILSAIFGGVIGTFSSTYKNFVNDAKSKPLRMLRSSVVSFAFAYTLQAWSRGVHSLSVTDMTGLLAHASILTNIVINNYTKDYWGSFSRIRDNLGLSRSDYLGNQRIANNGYMFGDENTGIRRTGFEYQMIGMVPYLIKMMDLVHFSVQAPIIGKIALGKMVFWSSIVYAQYAMVKYAEATGYEGAATLRAQWEDFKHARFLTTPLRQHAHRAYEWTRRAILGERASSCEAQMLPENTSDIPEAELQTPEEATQNGGDGSGNNSSGNAA